MAENLAIKRFLENTVELETMMELLLFGCTSTGREGNLSFIDGSIRLNTKHDGIDVRKQLGEIWMVNENT